MIDISHPSTAELNQHYRHTNHDRQGTREHEANGPSKSPVEEPEDDEEAAWLRSVQADDITQVKGLQSGALVMDVSQLRTQDPPSSAKKSLRSAIR